MNLLTRVAGLSTALGLALVHTQAPQPTPSSSSVSRSTATSTQRQFLDRYCATCHNDRLKTGGLSLDHVEVSRPDAEPEVWEKVIRKLRTGVMPPPTML